MTNWLNWPVRWALICRTKLKTTHDRRQASRSPTLFRSAVRLSEDATKPFGQLIQPWQATDFAALDPAWLLLAGHDVDTSIRRAWIERPRGHGKTADMALQLAWILLFSQHRIEGLAAAADRDQGTLIRDALLRLSLANPEWFSPFAKYLCVQILPFSDLIYRFYISVHLYISAYFFMLVIVAITVLFYIITNMIMVRLSL